MTIQSSYQSFLIGEGKSKTGLFSYLESWVKPQDAYDTLLNAYVYRGSLWQREGIILFPSKTGNGSLVYQNNEIQISTGNGTMGPFLGILSNFPLIGTVTITALTAAGKRSSTATFGTGNRPWSTGGTSLATAGSINYSVGTWTIMTSSNVVNNTPILIQYNFVPTLLTTPINNPIMGIKTHHNQATNTQTLIVMDTQRASWWNASGIIQSFVPLATFQQIFWQGNGDVTILTTGNITLQWTDIAPFSVSIFDGTDTIQDNPGTYPNGTFTHNGNALPDGTNFAAGSTINYATGVIKINFTAGQANTVFYTITAALQGDYFSGNNTNFFNAVNWQTTEDQPAYLYMTNNFDFVTLFDGTNLARPPFAITVTDMILDSATSVPLYPKRNDIETTLDIKLFQNRLMFLRPTTIGFSPDTQSIRWSQEASIFTPLANFNFVADVAGNGGERSASTGDWLQCAQHIRDAIVVFFQNSTWLFRFTGNTNIFRWDQLNISRSTNAPYGSIAYDVNATSMGAKGLISCDGVGVDRYDINVIDQFLDINQSSFSQCFAEKFDTLNQTWMLYPDVENNSTTSDSVLVYNFLEETWAKFQHNLGKLVSDSTEFNTLSCLGLAFTTKDLTWADFAPGGYFGTNGLNWSQATFSWNSYVEQDLSPTLLGGDQNGFVYTMQDGPVDNHGPDQSTPLGIPTLIQTKRLNPFAQLGERARFGYLDVYYEINPAVQVTFNFYINSSESIAQSNSFTFVGPSSNEWAWKRIYLNVVGEFLQIEIDSQIGSQIDGTPIYNTAGVFKILGMILYASPAGRLTPGTFT